MELFIILFTRLAINDLAKPLLTKLASQETGRLLRFILQFFTALVIASIAVSVIGVWSFGTTFWLILTIGFVQAFGTYCHWRAFDISMSKTSLYTWGDDIIAMLLAVVRLGEGSIINLPMGAGILCSLLAIMLFSRNDAVKQKKEAEKKGKASVSLEIKETKPPALWFWILGYSVLWGGSIFFLKYFALKSVPLTSFLQPWYTGATLMALLLYATIGRSIIGKEWRNLRLRYLVLPIGLGACILGGLSLAYEAFEIAPLIVVQPIFLVAEMAFPVLIGLIGFAEHKTYDRFDWICFGLGVMGVFLIAAGYALG